MTFDRVDYISLVKKKNEERVREQATDLRYLTQAAVKAGNLTGIPEWDAFLSHLQAAVEKARTQRDHWLAIIADPRIVDHDSIIAAKIGLTRCDAWIEAWEQAMDLPAQLMRAGSAAKIALKGLDDEPDAA